MDMRITDSNISMPSRKTAQSAPQEHETVQRDLFDRGENIKGLDPARAAMLKQLQAVDGSSINTQWGYGENENAFNGAILKGIKEKWGDLQPPVPPLVIKSDIAQESSFDPRAVSKTGYVGLMQVGKNEALAQGLSLEPVDERYIPEKNILCGVGTMKTKFKVVSNPLETYGSEDFGKNVAQYYKDSGAPSEKQLWFLTLGAFNGGGGTVLRAMNYAIADHKDPREWKNLIEPKDSIKKSPLFRGIVDVFGDKFATGKYYEMGKYPVEVMKRAGLISSAQADEMNIVPSDFEKGDIEQYDPVNTVEMIQAIKDNKLQSDRDLDDPLPAIKRPGTKSVVDESRDSDAQTAPGSDRTFGHKRVKGEFFDGSGNWLDLGTAVAADQLQAMPDSQKAEFIKATGAKPEEITPGDGSIMLVPATENWGSMNASKPAITYDEIDYSKIGKVTIKPKSIVIHYTGGVNDSAKGVRNWFDQNKGKPSTQFIVGKDGGILQIMPETQKCHGTLDFNSDTIQIEVCGNFRSQKETDEEFNSTVALVKYLQKEHKIADTNIISHRQVDNNFGHVGRKPDPGFRFMNRLYDALR
jgi:soluble lytic murein transglycosylase-like protein